MAGIYGLSGSGMDIDEMVKTAMKGQRAKYDRLKQKETQVEWKKTDYNTIYKSVYSFRNDIGANSVFDFTMQGKTIPKKTTSSNESVATVTANGDAANVNHSLTVTQLATGVTETSTGAITTGASKDTVAQQFGLADPVTKFDIKINGKTITVDPTKSITQVTSDINSAGAGVRANYDANLDRFFIYATDIGSNAGVDFTGSSAAGTSFVMGNLKLNTIASNVSTTGATSLSSIGVANPLANLDTQFAGLSGKFNLQINNGTATKKIEIDTANKSLQNIIDEINSAGVNASASYDAVAGTFTLKATSGNLNFSGSDSGAMDFLTNNLKLAQTKQTGQDAKIVLDGTSITQAKNNFSISGVSYTLKAAGAATVGVSPDVDKTIENVKSFVAAYNATLKQLNTELEEAKYKDYLPLTDDQKTAMKDADVTAWEAKAKSGMLYHDSILSSAVNKMRSDISAPVAGVTGVYNSLASIGINTTNWEEQGILHVDETKLRKALEGDSSRGLPADPDIVNKLFTAKSTSTDKGTAYSESGVATRLYDSLKAVTDRIATQAGTTAATTTDTKSNLAKQITAYKKQMTEMNTRLKTMQANLYTKYNAMENALAKLTKQSSWLSQQLGS